jgi:hypothetical protein
MVPFVPCLAAHAGRTIGKNHATQADRRFGVKRPEIRACEQAHLLLQRERRRTRGQIPFADRSRGLAQRRHDVLPRRRQRTAANGGSCDSVGSTTRGRTPGAGSPFFPGGGWGSRHTVKPSPSVQLSTSPAADTFAISARGVSDAVVDLRGSLRFPCQCCEECQRARHVQRLPGSAQASNGAGSCSDWEAPRGQDLTISAALLTNTFPLVILVGDIPEADRCRARSQPGQRLMRPSQPCSSANRAPIVHACTWLAIGTDAGPPGVTA